MTTRPPGRSHYRRRYLELRGALHDRVTGLPVLASRIETLRRAIDSGRRIGVVGASFPELALVESLYGWQVYDRILARAAEALTSRIGRSLPEGTDLVIDRVAGDRFVLIVPRQEDPPVGDDWLSGPTAVVDGALGALVNGEDYRGLNPRLRVRTGQAALTADPFHRFERRVYRAVEQALAGDGATGATGDALFEGLELTAVYQPVLDLGNETIVGFEGLVRGPRDSPWESPSALFREGRRVGRARELDRLCQQVVVRQSRGRIDDGLLFVNAVPSSVARGSLGLLDLIDDEQAEPDRIVVELSERAEGIHDASLARGVDALRKRGVRVALDDVATGQGSAELVERLQPEFVKLDTSIVRGIDKNPIKQEVLKTLIALARRSGADVVAEGIETREEAARLAASGARYGQGYFFAVPSPVNSPSLPGDFVPGSNGH